MIGLATGLFLLAGVVGIFSMNLKSNSDNLKMTRLNQELRSAIDLMQREIRRTGYWHLAASAASPPGNLVPSATSGLVTLTVNNDYNTGTVDAFTDFSGEMVGLQIVADGAAATIAGYTSPSLVSANVTNAFADTEPLKEGSWMIANPFSNATYDLAVSGSCITYAYDQDDPATNPTATAAAKTAVGNHERFGFRLANAAVEMYRYDASDPAVIDCTAAAEDDGWNPVTSSSVAVTALTFSNSNFQCVNLSDNSTDCNSASAGYVAPASGDILLWIREIDVTLTAQLASDTSVGRTLTDTIRLRNDKLMIN